MRCNKTYLITNISSIFFQINFKNIRLIEQQNFLLGFRGLYLEMGIMVWGFAIYWVIAAALSLKIALGAFRHYSTYGKIGDAPKQWKALVRDDFKQWNKKKIIVSCIVFVPIKFLVILIFQSLCIVLCYMQDLLGEKPWLIWLITKLLRVGKALFMCGLIIRVKEEFKKERISTPIIISNHVSWFDMYYLVLAHGPVSFLAKEELQHYPFLGRSAKGIKCIFLKRKNKDNRDEAIKSIAERIEQFNSGQNNTYPLIIFPEGTTSNGRGLLSFKSGAFDNLSPITAFCLYYQCEGCMVGLDQIRPLDSLVLFLSQWPSLRVKKIVLQPKQGETSDEYCERSKKMMADSFNFYNTEGGYRNCLQIEQYRKEEAKKKLS